MLYFFLSKPFPWSYLFCDDTQIPVLSLLNPSCSMVLGYNWLTHYNLMIDWVLGCITFRPQLLDPSFLSLTSSARAAKLLLQNPSASDEALKPSDSALRISLIGTAAFMHARKLPGTQSFRIHLSNTSLSTKSASLMKLLISPSSPKSTMTMRMSLIKPNLCSWPHIVPTTWR